jgi:hypothetical protein
VSTTITPCPACGSSAAPVDMHVPDLCPNCGASRLTAAAKHVPGTPRDAAPIAPESPAGVLGAKTGGMRVPAHPSTPAA